MLQHGWTLKYVTYTYHNQTKFKKRKKKKGKQPPSKPSYYWLGSYFWGLNLESIPIASQ